MNNDILVSIIIPAFNVEDIIENAINSVLNQTYKNTEIIIINDGSTDGTMDTLNRLSEQYFNIKVFSQENRGISAARNFGLSKAKGDYVIFLDSDDSFEPSFIESVLRKNCETKSDITFCLFKNVYTGKEIYSKDYRNLNNLAFNFLNFDYFGICCMLIKREFLLKNKIWFDESLIVGEDISFILLCICKAKFSYIPEYLYNYIYRNDSIMNKKWDVKNYIDEIQAWDKIYQDMNLQYHKKDREIFMKKVKSKALSLKGQLMWKMLASKRFDELSSFLSDFSYQRQDAEFIRKKNKFLFRLKIINSKSKIIWLLANLLLTKRKDRI
ncbi:MULTISPECIES: glycosyltransferase family 2 protein [unclassified Photorhabdus]|uniref:glycosyltransferase family 2 protein n=1 Tax=unclassified Photorhabdus TaxID=2620880 RepID=UPI000DCEE48C|nr:MULTISPECIES: glycosyltransferase family 2 protein [unclassified Photorhabdus]RAW99022.1 beta-1,3-glucosyltransferase [Photorhabdus sp. S10-54]RAW99048.1 beta-1,3-glucosyltransferase [Photorhabdus sp. S9-53]RAX03306.1 beta-1,3-glucosyltransferase [Photorhabdus sp. S8-52]